ncbi:hypothetical protein CTA2_2637 [Colletotrichum tanaceti]|uniref:Metallo-beta-lactamase domain-containing protein n=1 Tax=Colletotrichum tanaceti TaxID=1306861 RepID=A0A4U6XE48_9PEZI|nr:hypothetical protein CTA2_2637 [Colletotrichum tanaceti]TKW53519.1 hypothetical protein CTA1_4295 [Colletotrichum tanaceti]
MATPDSASPASAATPPSHTIKVSDRAGWITALNAQRPVLVHLNADTSWLLQLPYPPSTSAPPPERPERGRKRFNILLDPWLQGSQTDVASWFSTQWHVVEPSVKTMDQLNALLAGLEAGSVDPRLTDKPYIDAVVVSHEFTDHCHRATLEELPASTPVYAADKAARLIRSWGHFDSVAAIPDFLSSSSSSSSGRGRKDDSSISVINNTSRLPPWIGIERVTSPGNAMNFHSAVMVAFDLGRSRRTEAILYSPHGIRADDLACVRDSGFSTLALLHGLHDVRIWMAKQLNLGAANGVRAVGETGAKYWVATHDEAKRGAGLVAPLLRRRDTLKEAVEAETKRAADKVPEYRFVELGSGDGLLLE